MDLPHGRIDSGGPDRERLVALPAAWFGDVLESLAEGHGAFADRLAGAIVAEAAASLDDPEGCAPDEVAWALSLAFARRGLGLAAFERWGDALLFVWRAAPAEGGGGEEDGEEEEEEEEEEGTARLGRSITRTRTGNRNSKELVPNSGYLYTISRRHWHATGRG